MLFSLKGFASIKIVITDSNEDQITHNIFYSAVTRTRKSLKVFWTTETQQKVLHQLSLDINTKDVNIISNLLNLSRVIDKLSSALGKLLKEINTGLNSRLH